MDIDLRNCKPGDVLISKHGDKLIYVKPLSEENYYDHEVMYSNGSYGTRTHDGHVYRIPSKRLPGDHDIVKIIHKEDRE